MWCESDISCVMAPAPSCALACDKAMIADNSVKVCTCNHVFCIACWEMRAYRSCDYRLPFSVYYQTVWYGLGVYLPKRGFDHVVFVSVNILSLIRSIGCCLATQIWSQNIQSNHWNRIVVFILSSAKQVNQLEAWYVSSRQTNSLLPHFPVYACSGYILCRCC